MAIFLRIYAVLFALFAASTILMPMDYLSALTVFVRACNIFAFSNVGLGIFLYAFDFKFLSAQFWRFTGTFWAILAAISAAVVLNKASSSPQGLDLTPFVLMLLIFVLNYYLIHRFQKSLPVG